MDDTKQKNTPTHVNTLFLVGLSTLYSNVRPSIKMKENS